MLDEHARAAVVVDQAEAWRQVAATPAVLPAVQPEVDTYDSAGQLSVSLDVETTRMLLGEVPAAFHAGVQDILLIAFGLAWARVSGRRGAPIGIDVEGHGRHEELDADVDLSRTVGWFTTKYPVALSVGGLDWAQVVAGDARAGGAVKDAKEQLRALPDGLTYGLLRYVNAEVDLDGPTRRSGSTTWDGWARSPMSCPGNCGGSATDGLSLTGACPRRCRCRWPHRRSSMPAPLDTDGRPTAAGQLDVGALGARPRAGQPVEPVVVRGPGRDLRARAPRRRRADPVGYRPRPADPAAARRTVPAHTRSLMCCR